jgi:16S rRNA (cytidine1402-2'-O)-methyltransferase
MGAGRLYLLPAWLADDTDPAGVIPAPVLERIRRIDAFVVEDAKSARRFLAACGHPRPLREIAMAELNEHTPADRVAALLEPALAGRDLGVLSEAGAPAVADPGALLVAEAHRRGVVVVPCVGPSSILLALMASGLEGQRFRFHGYLPRDAAGRAQCIRSLEQASRAAQETQIFIETPYRNDVLLAALLECCAPHTRLCVAIDLTLPDEAIATRRIAEWRRARAPIGRRPAVFLLLA